MYVYIYYMYLCIFRTEHIQTFFCMYIHQKHLGFLLNLKLLIMKMSKMLMVRKLCFVNAPANSIKL